ncbi:MAG: Mpo1-like protein [Casimicrobiaceae bacterium]
MLDLMVQYAAYHRDRRNIATHFIGIPLIVFAIGVLLARVPVAGFTVAWLAWGLATTWYLTRGSLVLGLATSVVNAVLIALAHPLATGSITSWLAWKPDLRGSAYGPGCDGFALHDAPSGRPEPYRRLVAATRSLARR